MKRIIALLILTALVFSLASCGGANENTESSVEPVTTAASEAATEAETEGAPDFDAMAEELKAQIVGSWTFYNRMYKTTSNHLVFNEDGTGSYQGGVAEDGKYEHDYTFTYTISVDYSEYSDKYFTNTLTVNYNETGETEKRALSFLEDGTMMLGQIENWIIQYDEYIREENVPQS